MTPKAAPALLLVLFGCSGASPTTLVTNSIDIPDAARPDQDGGASSPEASDASDPRDASPMTTGDTGSASSQDAGTCVWKPEDPSATSCAPNTAGCDCVPASNCAGGPNGQPPGQIVESGSGCHVCITGGTWNQAPDCVCNSSCGSLATGCTLGEVACDGSQSKICAYGGVWLPNGPACQFGCMAGICQ